MAGVAHVTGPALFGKNVLLRSTIYKRAATKINHKKTALDPPLISSIFLLVYNIFASGLRLGPQLCCFVSASHRTPPGLAQP